MIKKIVAIPVFLLTLCLTILFLDGPNVFAASNLEDGTYSLPVKVLKANSSEVSMMQNYIEPVASLIVKGGKQYAQMTLKDSSSITGFKVEQNGTLTAAKIISSHPEKNTRVVEFEVANLSASLKGWVSVYIEMPGFLYDHNYDIQLKFDPSLIKKVAANQNVDSSQGALVLYLNNKKALSNGAPFILNEAPYLKNNYTFVPIRFISENFGASVNWNSSLRTVTISYQNKTISLKEGSKSVTVNGKAQTIDTAVQIKQGTTFVPVRFVTEQLGANVVWDQKQQSITIKK